MDRWLKQQEFIPYTSGDQGVYDQGADRQILLLVRAGSVACRQLPSHCSNGLSSVRAHAERAILSLIKHESHPEET